MDVDKSGKRSRLPLFGNLRKTPEPGSPRSSRRATRGKDRSGSGSPDRRSATNMRTPSQSPKPTKSLLSRKSKSPSSSPGRLARSPEPQSRPSEAGTRRLGGPSSVAVRNRAQHAYEAREITDESMKWNEPKVARAAKRTTSKSPSGRPGLSGLLKLQNGFVRGLKSRMSSGSEGSRSKTPTSREKSPLPQSTPEEPQAPKGTGRVLPPTPLPPRATPSAVPPAVALKSRSLPVTKRDPVPSPDADISSSVVCQSSPALPRAVRGLPPSPRPSPRVRRALPPTPDSANPRICDHNDNISMNSKQSMDNSEESLSVNNNTMQATYATVNNNEKPGRLNVHKRELRTRLLRYTPPGQSMITPMREQSPLSPNSNTCIGSHLAPTHRRSGDDDIMSRNTDSDSLQSITMESERSMSIESPRGSVNLSGSSPLGSVSRLSSDESMGSQGHVRPLYKRSYSSPTCGVRMAELRAATKRHAFSPPPIDEQEEGMVRSPSSCSSQRQSPGPDDDRLSAHSGSQAPLMFTLGHRDESPYTGSMHSMGSSRSDHCTQRNMATSTSPPSQRRRHPSGNSMKSHDSNRSLSRGSERSISRDSSGSHARDLRSLSRDSNTSLPRSAHNIASRLYAEHLNEGVLSDEEQRMSAYEYRVNKYIQSSQSIGDEQWANIRATNRTQVSRSVPHTPEPIYAEPDVWRRSPSTHSYSGDHVGEEEHIYESIPDLTLRARMTSPPTHQAGPAAKPSMMQRPVKPRTATPKCDGATQTTRSTVSATRNKPVTNRPSHSNIQRPQGSHQRNRSPASTSVMPNRGNVAPPSAISSNRHFAVIRENNSGASQTFRNSSPSVHYSRPATKGSGEKGKVVSPDRLSWSSNKASVKSGCSNRSRTETSKTSPSQSQSGNLYSSRRRAESPSSSTERESSSDSDDDRVSLSSLTSSSSGESIPRSQNISGSNISTSRMVHHKEQGQSIRTEDQDSTKSAPCPSSYQPRAKGTDSKSLGDRVSLPKFGENNPRGSREIRNSSLYIKASFKSKMPASGSARQMRGTGIAYGGPQAAGLAKFTRPTPGSKTVANEAHGSSRNIGEVDPSCDKSPRSVQSPNKSTHTKSNLPASRIGKPRPKASSNTHGSPSRTLPQTPNSSGVVEPKFTKSQTKTAAISRLATEKSQLKSKSIPKSKQSGDNTTQMSQNTEQRNQTNKSVSEHDTGSENACNYQGSEPMNTNSNMAAPSSNTERKFRPPVPVRTSSLKPTETDVGNTSTSDHSPKESAPQQSQRNKSSNITSGLKPPQHISRGSSPKISALPAPNKSAPSTPMSTTSGSDFCVLEPQRFMRQLSEPSGTVGKSVLEKAQNINNGSQKTDTITRNSNTSKLCKPYQRSKLTAPKWNQSFLKNYQADVKKSANDNGGTSEAKTSEPSKKDVSLDDKHVVSCSVESETTISVDSNVCLTEKFGANLDIDSDVRKCIDKDIESYGDGLEGKEQLGSENDIEIETVEVSSHIEHYKDGDIVSRKSTSSGTSVCRNIFTDTQLSFRGRHPSGASNSVDSGKKNSDTSFPEEQESPLCDSGIMSESSEDSMQISPDGTKNSQAYRKSSRADSMLDHSNCSSGEDAQLNMDDNCGAGALSAVSKHDVPDKSANSNETKRPLSDGTLKKTPLGVRLLRDNDANDSDGTVTLSDDENHLKNGSQMAGDVYICTMPPTLDSASSCSTLKGSITDTETGKNKMCLNEKDLAHAGDSPICDKRESNDNANTITDCDDEDIGKYEAFVEDINALVEMSADGLFTKGPLRSSDRSSSDSQGPVCLNKLEVEVERGVLGQVKRNKKRGDAPTSEESCPQTTSPMKEKSHDNKVPSFKDSNEGAVSIATAQCDFGNVSNDTTSHVDATIGMVPGPVVDEEAQCGTKPTCSPLNSGPMGSPHKNDTDNPTSATHCEDIAGDQPLDHSVECRPDVNSVTGQARDKHTALGSGSPLNDKEITENVSDVQTNLKRPPRVTGSQQAPQPRQSALPTAANSPRLSGIQQRRQLFQRLNSSGSPKKGKGPRLRHQNSSPDSQSPNSSGEMESPVLKPKFFISSNESLERLTCSHYGGYVCNDSSESFDNVMISDELNSSLETSETPQPGKSPPSRSCSSPSLQKQRYEERKKATQQASAFLSGAVQLKRTEGTSDINLKVEREQDVVMLGSSPLDKCIAASETSLLQVMRSISGDLPENVTEDDVVEELSRISLESVKDGRNEQVSQVASQLRSYIERQISQGDDVININTGGSKGEQSVEMETHSASTDDVTANMNKSVSSCSGSESSLTRSSGIPKPRSTGSKIPTKGRTGVDYVSDVKSEISIISSQMTSSSDAELSSSAGKLNPSSPRIDEGYDTLRTTEKVKNIF